MTGVSVTIDREGGTRADEVIERAIVKAGPAELLLGQCYYNHRGVPRVVSFGFDHIEGFAITGPGASMVLCELSVNVIKLERPLG